MNAGTQKQQNLMVNLVNRLPVADREAWITLLEEAESYDDVDVLIKSLKAAATASPARGLAKSLEEAAGQAIPGLEARLAYQLARKDIDDRGAWNADVVELVCLRIILEEELTFTAQSVMTLSFDDAWRRVLAGVPEDTEEGWGWTLWAQKIVPLALQREHPRNFLSLVPEAVAARWTKAFDLLDIWQGADRNRDTRAAKVTKIQNELAKMKEEHDGC